MKYGFSKSSVPPNSVLFGGTVPPNSVLFGGSVPGGEEGGSSLFGNFSQINQKFFLKVPLLWPPCDTTRWPIVETM